MTMELKPGIRVRIKKPMFLTESPCWNEDMDQFDGKIVTLEKQDDNGWWRFGGQRYVLSEKWLTVIDNFSTDIQVREIQTVAMIESLLLWNILKGIPTGIIRMSSEMMKDKILRQIIGKSRAKGCPLCENFHQGRIATDVSYDCPIGFCEIVTEDFVNHVPCQLTSYGVWEELMTNHIHNQEAATAFFDELFELSTNHVIEAYLRESKMISHIDVSPETLFGGSYEEAEPEPKAYYVYGDWYWYWQEGEWKEENDDTYRSTIEHGTKVYITDGPNEDDKYKIGFSSGKADHYGIRMKMLVKKEPTSRPIPSGTVMYINDDYSYFGGWVNNLEHPRQLEEGTKITILRHCTFVDECYEVDTETGSYNAVRPDMLSEVPPIKTIPEGAMRYIDGDWYFDGDEWIPGAAPDGGEHVSNGEQVTVSHYRADKNTYIISGHGCITPKMLTSTRPHKFNVGDGIRIIHEATKYMNVITTVTEQLRVDDEDSPDHGNPAYALDITGEQVWDEDMLRGVKISERVDVDEYLKIIRELPSTIEDPTFRPFEMEVLMKVKIESREDSELFHSVVNHLPFGSGEDIWAPYRDILVERNIKSGYTTVQTLYNAWKKTQ